MIRRTCILAVMIATIAGASAFSQTPEPPSAGNGSVTNPWQIANISNLYWLTQSATNWDKHYIQSADINASGTAGWDGGRGLSPIGDPGRPFSGSYDGQGAVISSLTINRATNGFVGLFGYVRGEVGNLGLPGAFVTGARFVGALAGAAALGAEVSSCSASGTVNGAEYIGGLVGSVEDGATLDLCSSLAAVNGGSYVGGLVGRNVSAVLLQCFSAGAVTASNSPVGGLVGNNSAGATSNSFWDIQASGQAQSGGGTGKTTAEMKDMATYTAAGWDFVDETAGTNDWWNLDPSGTVNAGYPVPSWTVVAAAPAGDGSTGNPYQIATLNNLYWLSSFEGSVDGSFIQTADISARSTAYINFGKGFAPIGHPFRGSYDGQDHRIIGLTINRPNDLSGLFSQAYALGRIENLGLLDVNITGWYAGGFYATTHAGAGFTLSDCYCSGTVQGTDSVGGLVGTLGVTDLQGTGLVERCWFSGRVVGSNGGFPNSAGGLVGMVAVNNGAAITNCFWDTETSGQTNSAGGTGKTTAEMKTQSTFADAGWDFAGTWRMTEGVTYPLLSALSACITATAGPNGSIAPSGSVYVALNDDVGFAITPDEFYHVDDVTTNDGSVGAVTNFTWSNVVTDGTIHATFAADEAPGGTPHWWLASYGLTNGGLSFAEAETNDTDEDAFTAGDEYVADTIPTNGDSFFQLTDVTHDSPVTVYFDSSTGRLYTMQGGMNLVDGAWTNVSGAGPRMGAGGADSMNDTNDPSRGPFYRLEVQIP